MSTDSDTLRELLSTVPKDSVAQSLLDSLFDGHEPKSALSEALEIALAENENPVSPGE